MFLSNILLGRPLLSERNAFCLKPGCLLCRLPKLSRWKVPKVTFALTRIIWKKIKIIPEKSNLKYTLKVRFFVFSILPERFFLVAGNIDWHEKVQKLVKNLKPPELGLRFAILEIVYSLRNYDQPQLMPTDFGSFCFCCSWNLNKAIQLCRSKYANKGQIYFFKYEKKHFSKENDKDCRREAAKCWGRIICKKNLNESTNELDNSSNMSSETKTALTMTQSQSLHLWTN